MRDNNTGLFRNASLGKILAYGDKETILCLSRFADLCRECGLDDAHVL